MLAGAGAFAYACERNQRSMAPRGRVLAARLQTRLSREYPVLLSHPPSAHAWQITVTVTDLDI
jgi:hypothetical protein